MISAVNELPIDSHPLIVGRPAAQISFSLFLITLSSSKDNLCELGVQVVGNAFAAALSSQPRIIGSTERGFRCGESKGIDADHPRFQGANGPTGPVGRT